MERMTITVSAGFVPRWHKVFSMQKKSCRIDKMHAGNRIKEKFSLLCPVLPFLNAAALTVLVF